MYAALAADPGSDGEFAGGEFAGVHADHGGQVRETYGRQVAVACLHRVYCCAGHTKAPR